MPRNHSIVVTLATFIAASAAENNCASGANSVGVAQQLVDASFKCPIPVTTSSGLQYWHKFTYSGTDQKFDVKINDLNSSNSDPSYTESTGEYSTFLHLLYIDHHGRKIRLRCEKPACLFHRWVDTGCDNGICANAGNSSLRSEYISGVEFEMCDETAAADAADGLAELVRRAKLAR